MTYLDGGLEFTPLEFETSIATIQNSGSKTLEFTPLEFETKITATNTTRPLIRIYSVGV